MNLLNLNTTKYYIAVILLTVMTIVSHKLHAQNQYTTISKNINPEAQNLYHDLSPQGDTLYLKAESIFYKVTFLNSLDRKVFTFNPPVLAAKIPLRDIIIGDYTILVYKKDRIIAFHITRLLEIQEPYELIASREISITNEIPFVKPVLPKIIPRENGLSKIVHNEIKMDDTFELSMVDFKVAVNDDSSNRDGTNSIVESKSYNLSSLDRTNMQSREEFRRNNVRPNGKPYY